MFTIGKALVLIVLYVGINLINSHSPKPKLLVEKQETEFNFSIHLYQFLSMGNRRLISSLMWVQTLLDSDIEHYKSNDLNSWMFIRFDQMTKLEPKFLSVYIFGGQYLSIIKDDASGAEQIYRKGLKQYPADYQLNSNAAFHYLFELNQPDKAIEIYEKIQHHPLAPAYLPSFVARLKVSEQGDLQGALKLISEAYSRTPSDSPMRAYFLNSLYAIRAELDLKCLNENKDNCSKKDLEGSLYLLNTENKFYAPKKWTPFRRNGFSSN